MNNAPIQLFKNKKEGEIVFHWLKNFSYDKKKQESVLKEICKKHDISMHEARQIIAKVD